jgi:hypothetical protein
MGNCIQLTYKFKYTSSDGLFVIDKNNITVVEIVNIFKNDIIPREQKSAVDNFKKYNNIR